MMENANDNWAAMSDGAIISTIGDYVKHQRLAQNKTQAQIAEHAGINRWTLSQLENGQAITLTSLIQILRALDLLHLFNVFEFEDEISPIELAKRDKQKRKRAHNAGSQVEEPKTDW
jgi:transcriptional regulator with XRE-family HTH domain